MNKKSFLNRKQIVTEIQNAAKEYKKNLVGRKFLYVFEGRWIEVLFTTKSFKHLTGVDSSLSAKDFFSNALKRHLGVNNISFSNRHPYNLCVRKIAHLSSLCDLAIGEGFLLEDISTNTQSFKFGSTDLDFTLLFNPQKDASGNIIGDCLSVESLRDEDCFSRSNNVYEISHILSKRNDQKLYDTIHFIDNRYTITDVPKEVMTLIDSKLLNQE